MFFSQEGKREAMSFRKKYSVFCDDKNDLKTSESKVLVNAGCKLRQSVLDEFNLAITDLVLEEMREEFIKKNQLSALKFLDSFLEDVDKIPVKAMEAQGLDVMAPDMVML